MSTFPQLGDTRSMSLNYNEVINHDPLPVLTVWRIPRLYCVDEAPGKVKERSQAPIIVLCRGLVGLAGGEGCPGDGRVLIGRVTSSVSHCRGVEDVRVLVGRGRLPWKQGQEDEDKQGWRHGVHRVGGDPSHNRSIILQMAPSSYHSENEHVHVHTPVYMYTFTCTCAL